MCQLLGMNCNVPTDIQFSFEGFRRRGGQTDCHQDGWGIAFFEGRGCRLFLDCQPSATSAVAELVRQYPIKSTNVIAHIRKATTGEISLANTHPFMRELWGHYWIFAHNGDLKELPPLKTGRFTPVGNTDSEHAFCWILEQLATQYGELPSLPLLQATLADLAKTLSVLGTFNFMLSNGHTLFAHCSTQLHYLIRKAPFSIAHLIDEDVQIDFTKVTTVHDRVAVITTVPLTDNEPWTAFKAGELIAFQGGEAMFL